MSPAPGGDGERSRTGATVLVAAEEFTADHAEVTGDTYRHLFRARRLAVGDRLRVVDGAGRAREGRVARVERDRARLELGEALAGREAPCRLSLIVAAPRGERASWLVEKATELGVAEIAWISTERSARAPSAAQIERHRRVAAAALEQCGRAALPAISGPHPWSALARLVAGFDRWWTLDPAGERRRLDAAEANDAPGRVGLVIGPEGGWTGAERAELAGLGGRSWTLGERVLRVETAAVCGAALLLTPA